MSIALCVSASARAEGATASRASAALFATSGAGDDDAALDPSLLAAIEKLGAVRVTARPGVDLETVQLAIDCAGQSSACLHAVAATSGTDGLIASTLTRTDRELVLNLIYFDAQHERITRSERKQAGSVLTPALLDAIPSMLRELFGLPAEAIATPVAAAPAPKEAPPATETMARELQPPAAVGGGAKS
ncbi:MAG TPA: hypothetical protein VHZ95_06600, partial [Polyangiales bacterium]|nr:hypothetical protein [Polyangiales bacterium]